MPAGRPAKRVALAVRPPSARRAAPTRLTEPDLPAPPVRRRRIASAAAGRPDDLPKDTASTASMVAIVTREVLKQLREDRDAALPPPSLPAPVLPAPETVHKLADMADPTQHFVIKKLLAGAQKLAAKPDTRLPITPTVLHEIVDATPFIVSSNYVCYMLQSMFLLSFHAFLRIGEITIHSKARHAYVIQVSDVTISNSSLTLVMCHFKHNTSGRPVTLSISRTHDKYCPVLALSRFLTVRGTVQGPLYAFANATPVSRNFFCNHLTKTLKYAGLDPDKYKGHSFRIGAATAAADSGLSETQIQTMGRWKSSAFKRYVRIPVLRMSER